MSERKAFSAGMRAALVPFLTIAAVDAWRDGTTTFAAVFGYMAATSAWDGLRSWLAMRP